MNIIYGLFDPLTDELRYVGFTSKPLEDRIKDHKFERGKTHKNNWIRSLRKAGTLPRIEEIDKCGDDWQELERFYIEYFRFIGCRLTNYLPGGEHGPILKGTKQKLEHKINSGKAKRKTTEEQDIYIRKEFKNGKKIKDLMKEFSVSRFTIMRICNGRKNSFDEKRTGKFTGKRKLSYLQAQEIRELYRSGKENTVSICKIYNVDIHAVHNIIHNKSYKAEKSL